MLAVTFSRQSCRSIDERATPPVASDSTIITEPPFENQGMQLAQVSGAGVGNRNWKSQLDATLHLVKFLPRHQIWRGETMKAEMDDGCTCPRCHDQIPAQFYCRTCGYLPDWRQMTQEKNEVSREAA